jgi:uncharacterized protein (TIGR00661 family)
VDRQKNILISPLEWGLGHAGRTLCLAEELRKQGNKIFFAAGKVHLEFLKKESPDAEFLNFPGFKPRYSKVLPQYLAMLFQTPVLLFHIIKDHLLLPRLIKSYSIDLVISDNRFGMWTGRVPCVYITHMLIIPLPPELKGLESIGKMLHRWIITRYDYCLIPDLPGETNLSGRLSHGIKHPHNVRYAGLLSRFINSAPDNKYVAEAENPVLLILSGPEPQKSIFRDRVIRSITGDRKKLIILEGRPDAGYEKRTEGLVSYISLPSRAQMAGLIRWADLIITRSGYTSIMELVSLGRSAVLIPTPGQTEQEYLAEWLSDKGWFRTVRQNEISEELFSGAEELAVPEGLPDQSRVLLNAVLKEILNGR